MIDARFPGAPPSSYVCEEGWLVIGQEAWTEAEWRAQRAWRGRTPVSDDPSKYRNRYATDEERQQARRAARRRYRERQRLGLPRIGRRPAA